MQQADARPHVITHSTRMLTRTRAFTARCRIPSSLNPDACRNVSSDVACDDVGARESHVPSTSCAGWHVHVEPHADVTCMPCPCPMLCCVASPSPALCVRTLECVDVSSGHGIRIRIRIRGARESCNTTECRMQNARCKITSTTKTNAQVIRKQLGSSITAARVGVCVMCELCRCLIQDWSCCTHRWLAVHVHVMC